jgi:hypothetical protein
VAIGDLFNGLLGMTVTADDDVSPSPKEDIDDFVLPFI